VNLLAIVMTGESKLIFKPVGPILDVELDAARKAFETNFFAPLRLAQLVVPHMAEQGGGIVVNVGSVAGHM
jgi:short-subunit dehydrogenase